MASNSKIDHDDQAIIDAGYKPQLKRSLGFIASFAVTFSSMSVLCGIFSNFGYVLGKAGPFGFWSWPVVGFGQLLVALVFAEMVGRIPLTGAIYNWNTRLANPAIGWLCAWMLLLAYWIGAVGVLAAMLPPLQTLLGVELNSTQLRCIGVGAILLQALINIYGVQLAAHLNKLAVFAEITTLAVFGILLLAVILAHNEVHVALLTTMPATPTPYWPAFLLASLMGAWTIIGFELAADLSEETVNVRRVTSRSIISGILTTIVAGFAFIAILIFAIPDLASVTVASDPISMIVGHHLGPVMEKVFLVFVIVAIFAVDILVMAGGARILFALARDKRAPGAAWLTGISSHKVPVAATLTTMVAEFTIFLVAKDAVDLFASSTVLFFFVYLITVISFATGLKKLPPSQSFSLGRWRWPVVILAAVWLIAEIGVLTIPEDFHNAAYIAGGALFAGLLLYIMIGRHKRPIA